MKSSIVFNGRPFGSMYFIQEIFLFLVLFTNYDVSMSSPNFPKVTTVNRCMPMESGLNQWSRGCGCKYSDTGEVVSLYELQTNYSKSGDPKKPRFQGHDKKGWYYSFNPCTDFSKFQDEIKKHPKYRPCKNVAAARWTNGSTHQCFALGNQASATFENWEPGQLNNLTVSNLTVTFRNSSTKYGMTISLVCNKAIPANKTVFTYLGTMNKPDSTYFFKLESVCCCPGGCQSGYHPPSNKISKELWYIIGIGAGLLLFLLVLILIVYVMQSRKRKKYRAISDEQEPIFQTV